MFKHKVLSELKKLKRGQECILSALGAVLRIQEKIMSAQQDALKALEKINEATNQQGENLQTVSDNLDALIAKLGTSVPQDVLDGLQTAADHIAAQAEFSKALASKGSSNPVPVEPPSPPAPNDGGQPVP
jgi:ABC-type transporter Mla subunit MlaD